MRTALLFSLIAVTLLLVGGCSDDSTGTSEVDSNLGDILGINPADPPGDASDNTDLEEEDHSGEEGEPSDTWTEDDVDAGPSTGGFGDPCSENQDCDSGLCVENYDGSVCTDFCVDECPKGWACKDVSGASPDVIYACVPTAVDLCKPCDQNTDCGGSYDLCTRPEEDASFGYCGVSCDLDVDCPDGFTCAAADTMEGTTDSQCVATDGDCVCPPGALPGSPGCDPPSDDQDNDGIPDDEDNCMTHPNPYQENFDGDEWGDVCDPDDDNDLDPDITDCEPFDPAIYTGAEEVCDGIDNNCNDLIDEGFADSDADGLADCVDPDDDDDTDPDDEDCEPLNPLIFHGAEELCDGIDNNCNGEIDEGFEDTDQDGVLDCLDNDSDNDGDPDASDCAPFDPAINHMAEEVCDGVDNDCDTLVDEGFPNFDNDNEADCIDDDDDNDGDPDTDDCAPFNPAVYHNAVDLCDGLDNDCDGVIDQAYEWVGNPCDSDDSDLCGNGTYTCTADGLGIECINETLESIIEVCNNNDDDCDGEIDEDFPMVGAACDGSDADSCKTGTYMCDPTTVSLVCMESDATNTEEICNGIDDDCDGAIDEGFNITPELCNGVDDNCNGNIDETFPLLGETCDGDDEDACGSGTWTCSPDGLKVECINETEASKVEICNGSDDDCDGEIDEGFNITPEICNGIDDNCDGNIDELFPSLGQICDGDDADLCGSGTWTCNDDGTDVECINETQAPMQELCNGFDEDCDGEIDEDFALLGQACDGDDADSCANGTYVCASNTTEVACSNEEPAGIQEICNGQDDDCDGEIDEEGCLTIAGIQAEPHSSSQSMEDWYSYNVPYGSSANADLAISDQAIVYFYRDGDDQLSLVVTLDKPDDGTGGTTVMEINGATGMNMLVSDDGSEATLNSGTGTGLGNFNWIACCTDGLAIGYWTTQSCVTLSVTSSSGINNWVILHGDGTQEILPGNFAGSTLEICGMP